MKYNNVVAGYNQTNIGLKQKLLEGKRVPSSTPRYNQTNIGLKPFEMNAEIGGGNSL